VQEVTKSYEFDVDTDLREVGEGRFEGEYTGRWDTPVGRPNGGYQLAVAVAAMGRTTTFPDPLVTSAFYLRPANPGPIAAAVSTIRSGRTTATQQVSIEQGGKEILRATSTFADLSDPGRVVELGAPPDLPPALECDDPWGGQEFPQIPITGRFEYRGVTRSAFRTGEPTGDPTVNTWMRFRDGRPIDVAALPLIVDAVYPPVVELGEIFGSATMELSLHVRARPADCEWVLCRATTRHVSSGYAEEDFEIWTADGTLLAQSRQLSILTLAPND
jgi:acyl-CoA thioesterase